MSRIDGNVTDMELHRVERPEGQGAVAVCWVCQEGVSSHTAFCPACSTLQPARALDHFARLGLDCRFDIDRAQLDGRYRALGRIFATERFSASGPRQRQLALDHLAAVEEAYLVLRDPVRRAEHLLKLLDEPGLTPTVTANSNDLDVLWAQMEAARDPSSLDRVAFIAGRGVEASLHDLAGAFRQKSFAEVGVILARLTRLEDIAAEARTRRLSLQDA